MPLAREDIARRLAEVGYIADQDLATALWLMDFLKRPLLLEGKAGVGKTEVAKALAALHGAELIRLQCYEGLDQNATLYEWNYQRQLLAIKAREGAGEAVERIEEQIFSEKYLLERPLLAAIRRPRSPVLLIDEIDRADEEFEAFLLELLSDFQVTIPELGTISAVTIPRVVLTSNDTRELSDALRRRCLYHYVDFPDVDREAAIILARVPGVAAKIAGQIARMVAAIRREDLRKTPGVAETLDWAATLAGLAVEDLRDSPEIVHDTLICLLKTHEDRARVTREATSDSSARLREAAPWLKPKRRALNWTASRRRASPPSQGSCATTALRSGSPRAATPWRCSPRNAGRRPASLRSALRTLFCATRTDWLRFDALFDAFWLRVGMRRVQPLRNGAERRRAQARPAPRASAPDAAQSGTRSARRATRTAIANRAPRATRPRARARLPQKTSAISPTLKKRQKFMRSPNGSPGGCAARLVRRERARRNGRRLDIRRTIHRSVGHGGTPIDLVWRRRKDRPLRLVLLLDASGSMEAYTAFFVRFIHAVVGAFREAEAFLFHTHLVHVSSALREKDVGRAVDRLTLMAQGVGGGTRIGESLADFNRWHSERVVNSRTALIIVSDGYDTGEPQRLGDEMRRLARRCRRIVWLNPLIGWRDYEPTARGMQAALPYVDLFAPAHNLESLAALEPYLARI